MINNPLISVIVPIYKVENYLDECVECIVNQTYPNLEIILVDDGSPDSCPQKCEEWAKKDSRITVVHKKNGGLSSARNAGLEVATGEYFGFVDSDDLISLDMFEVLLDALQRHPGAGIANGMVMAFDGITEKPYKKSWVISEEQIISAADFLTKTLTLSVCHTAWTKLYRAEPFKDVRFPEGRNNEDSYYMFELSKVVEARHLDMVEVPHFVYYYRVAREGSICNDAKKPLALDILSNYEVFIDDLRKRNDPRADILVDMYNKNLVYFLFSMAKNKVWKEKYFTKFQPRLKNISYKDIRRIFSNNKGMCKHFLALKYMPGLYMKIKH